jgi:hypothetical protein
MELTGQYARHAPAGLAYASETDRAFAPASDDGWGSAWRPFPVIVATARAVSRLIFRAIEASPFPFAPWHVS